MKRKNLDRDQRVWEEINMSYHFLMDLALILLSTKILGLIAQKFQMPQVVGALIAGLILSPAGLGLLSETEFTKQLSELGVIVLMFSAGMGTDINELKHSGKAGFWVALLGVIVPLLMGTALVPLENVWPTILTYSLAGGALVGGLGSMFSIRKHLNV